MVGCSHDQRLSLSTKRCLEGQGLYCENHATLPGFLSLISAQHEAYRARIALKNQCSCRKSHMHSRPAMRAIRPRTLQTSLSATEMLGGLKGGCTSFSGQQSREQALQQNQKQQHVANACKPCPGQPCPNTAEKFLNVSPGANPVSERTRMQNMTVEF